MFLSGFNHLILSRSITSDSADLKQEGRERLVLTSKKGRLVEQSITQAYIQMIRYEFL